jgi:hypothetical protein
MERWQVLVQVSKYLIFLFRFNASLSIFYFTFTPVTKLSFPFDETAMDPLFWVAHGAVERLFQKAVFSNIFSDMVYPNAEELSCSGHDSGSSKFWLQGYYFADESIKSEELTNAELTNILVPTSDEYRDLINFVYDTADYSYCEDSESWFD